MALPFGDPSTGKEHDMVIELLNVITDAAEREVKIHSMKAVWVTFKNYLTSFGNSIPAELTSNEKAYI